MHLFISYAHADQRHVRKIAQLLGDAGHDSWFDHRLTVGRDWKQQLLEAIENCDRFVYVLSPASVRSEWCQWEFAQAVRLGKPIVPILVKRGTKIPQVLQKYQHADFSSGINVNAFARLLAGLSVTIPPDEIPPAPIDPRGEPAQLQSASRGIAAAVRIFASLLAVAALAAIAFIVLNTEKPGAQLAMTPGGETQAAIESTAVLLLSSTPAVAVTPTAVHALSGATEEHSSPTPVTISALIATTHSPTHTLTSMATATVSFTPTVTEPFTASATASFTPFVTSSPAPTLTAAPSQRVVTEGLPCDASIVASASQILKVVRLAPSSTSPANIGVVPDEAVIVVETSRQNSRTVWYQIARPNADPLGWIEPRYLELSPSCPTP